MPAWVDIDLDKPRKLRFQYNDVVDIENAIGKGFFQLINSLHFVEVRALLAYGLRWMDQSMTPVKAGQLIQEHWIGKGKPLTDLAKVLVSALRAGGMLEKEDPAATDVPLEGNEQPEAVVP